MSSTTSLKTVLQKFLVNVDELDKKKEESEDPYEQEFQVCVALRQRVTGPKLEFDVCLHHLLKCGLLQLIKF